MKKTPTLTAWCHVLLALLSTTSFAQQAPPIINTLKVIPPSPTAASLGRYGDVPISYYTGGANVSIPLYEIKTKDHTLAIKLDYSSNGFKVAEDASWAGLGWSLFAGGVITRTVKGLDDLNGFYRAPLFPASWDAPYPSQEWNDLLDRMRSIADGQEDSEPDIFSYNFGNYTGKFLIDKEAGGNTARGGNVVKAKSNNLRIEYKYDENVQLYFLATDDRGIKYFFNRQELTVNYDAHVPGYYGTTTSLPNLNDAGIIAGLQGHYNSQVISSWYLTKIESPSGETIDFEYNTSPFSGLSPVSFYEEQFISLPGMVGNGVQSNYHISREMHYQYFLKKIRFQNGYILFNNPATVAAAETARADIEIPAGVTGPTKLRSMEVYDNASVLKKKFIFDYGYFNASPTPDFNSRLRLDKVTEYGADGATAKPAYVFDYFNKDDQFREKISKAIDWFGFYNGKNANVNVLPEITGPDGSIYKGADRTPSLDLNDYLPGVLKAVTYPTGGRSEFQYERATFIQGIIPPKPITVQQTAFYTHVWSSSDECHNSSDVDLCVVPSISDPYVWTVTPEEAVASAYHATIEFSGTHDYSVDNGGGEGYESFPAPDANGNCSSDPLTTCGFLSNMAFVRLEYWSDPNVDLTVPNPPAPTSTVNLNGWPMGDCHCGQSNITLNPGKYRIVVPPNTISRGMSFDATLSYRGFTPQEINLSAAGIRVKSVANYNGTEKTSFKQFVYTDDGTTAGSSTGNLLNPPVISAIVPAVVFIMNAGNNGVEYTNPTFTQMLMRSSASQVAPDFVSGSSLLGHTKVTEIFGEQGEGGKIEYNYKNYAQVASTYPGLPGYSSPENGQLESVLYIDKNGTTIKRIDNVYTELGTSSVDALKVVSRIRNPDFWQTASADVYFYSMPYQNTSSWWELTQRKETEYAGGVANTVTTAYTYGNSGHKLITQEERNQSDGSTLRVTYQRPTDQPNFQSTEAYAKMDELNQIEPVIEEHTLWKPKDGTGFQVIDGHYVIYQNVAGDIVSPSAVYELQKTRPVDEVDLGYDDFQLEFEVDRYDESNGNVLEYHEAYDRPQTFVWGYDGALLVAEAKNAHVDQIFVEGFEEQLGEAFADASGKNLARSGRKVWPSGSYTIPAAFNPPAAYTYSMSYWYYADGGWKFSGEVSFDRNIVSSGTKIDDIRVFPEGAELITYTHDPLTGVTSVTDANAVSRFYTYDAFSRLSVVKDHEGNIERLFDYNYDTQTRPFNYIAVKESLVEGITTETDAATRTIGDITKTNRFFDGLGRPSQIVYQQASPAHDDIVQPIAYDLLGREAVHYLPYVPPQSDGSYKSSSVSAAGVYQNSPHYTFYTQASTTVARDTKPYAQTIFEDSPLNRVLKTGAPGEAFQPQDAEENDHTVKQQYRFNTENEVLLFRYDDVRDKISYQVESATEYYLPNQLKAVVATDAHHYEQVEFTDTSGKLILRKKQYGQEGATKLYAETYFIYDNLGNLITVLSPEAVKLIKH
ncbi:YD repeat-containing protein [Chryseolinea serpens]|uniref:YD repeat-containing protein n=1 Tax=Chryseolinea serpens TaxID=947013 RepID=A0A1M5XUG0_9BACT|nr:DUF6443 domain-containing protein [Chryseolinea serpens]SHI02893.1 YD repeat-containing protein [Chryseolinea serpens]